MKRRDRDASPAALPRTRSSPRTSFEPQLIALDDAVGDQLEQLALLAPRSAAPSRRRLAAATHLQRPAAHLARGRPCRDPSQTASARRRVEPAQVELGQRGVALAGEDQRQRHRAVEQVGAARLAGALRRAADVEHVVEQLEREADLARRRSGAARLLAALPAQARRSRRRTRTGARSSAGSARGSARSPIDVSKASWRWASSPRASATEAAPSRADGALASRVGGELARTRARTAGRRPRCARRGPGCGDHRRAAPPQRGRVEDVVVDQGRHVDQLDRRRGPDRRLARARRPRRAGRASGAAACRRPRASPRPRPRAAPPCPADASRPAAPRPPPSGAGSQALGGVEHRGDRRRAAGQRPVGPLTALGCPLWIAMIPPASTV